MILMDCERQICFIPANKSLNGKNLFLLEQYFIELFEVLFKIYLRCVKYIPTKNLFTDYLF